MYNKLTMSRRLSLPRSFRHATRGVHTTIRNEPNFRIHLSVGTVALIAAYVLKFSLYEWLLLFFTIFFVIILELVNSAVEALVDLVSPEIHEKARVAKDATAGAVILAALLSIIVGVGLFGPKIGLF